MPEQEKRGSAADSIAAEALVFLADDPGRIERFFALTGADPATIRTLARQRSFLAAVLDHVVADEALLRAFAAQSGLSPREVVGAQTRLSGRPWERDSA